MVNNIDTKVRYRGNGSNRVFPITFPFTDDDYVCVRIANDETGEVRELTSDFLVDNIANTVTYPGWATGQEPPVADQPAVLTSDETITIYRKTEISQLTELGIKFPLPQIERALDKVTNILQEHDEAIVRSVKVDISSEEEAGYYYEQMMVAANNAVESATAAAGSATSAANSASAAASSETAAAISATNAADSASAAAASALSASNSAAAAGTSANNAAASESVAGNAATSATASASAAATSAESASASQLAAAASAGAAASYAETSTTNASVAQSAANTCSSVLPQVLGAASNVATKANAAAASATAAALSASSAASDAETASNAATTATTKAGEAAASAVAAATSAASAADSATAASTSYDQAAVAVVNILDIVAEAAVTYPAQSGTQTYTGSVQTPNWDSYYQPNKMVITGDTSATDAGTYTVTFTPKSGYYWLADDTTTAKTQTWTIGRASIAAEPSQSGVVVYDGTAQSPTWSGYDSSQLTIGGDISGTEAGTYTATFTPTGNYKWYDGTTTAKSVTWTISAASVTIPTVTNTSKTYNGQSQAPTISGLDPLTVDVVDDASAINAGSYMITFRLKNASLVWSDGTTADKSVGWTIGPKTVTAPTITVSTLTYDGTAQGPTIGSYDTDAILISGTTSAVAAGSYSVICSLLSATNYVWSDSTTEPISTSWSILPLAVAVPSLSNTSKTYDGTAQSPTISPYDSNIVDVSGTVTATDAGTYTVTFHLLNASVKWSDDSTADKSDTWTIAPKPVTAPSVTDTSKTYTGSSQSPTIAAFSATEITQGGTASATNAGDYSVTFDLASANYIWSDDTTTQKSVSWSIAKAAGSLTLSKSSVSLTVSKTSDTVTVTRSGDGTITATSSNSSIATATISNGVITVTAVANGTANITVSATAGTNWLAPASQTIAVSVTLYRTMTVYIDESDSNPETCCYYGDDAVGMTPGSDDWDEIFGHYPCMLKSGVEGGKLKRDDFTKYEDGTSAPTTKTTAGDVMICFPRKAVSITKTGNIVKISLYEDPNKTSNEDIYFAHSFYGGELAEKFYLSAYVVVDDNSPCSIKGGRKKRESTVTYGTAISKINNKGAYYSNLKYLQHVYIQALFILKYKTLDYKSVIGTGRDYYYSEENTGALDTSGMDVLGNNTTNKLFGLEDIKLNGVFYRIVIGGVRACCDYFDPNKKTIKFYKVIKNNTLSEGELSSISRMGYGGYIKNAYGSIPEGFIAQADGASGGSSSTYYTSEINVNPGKSWTYGESGGSYGLFGIVFNSLETSTKMERRYNRILYMK